MNVQDYLYERGVTLPVLERDDWLYWEASSVVGQQIVKLLLEARTVLNLVDDPPLRDELWGVLINQCNIWAFG